MTRIAVYPGSFDPPTRGHEDLVRRARGLADHLVVAVAVNSSKQPLFSPEERVEMLRTILGPDDRVTVEAFPGLLADFLRMRGASLIVRGLRAAGDFEYELQMAMMNRELAPDAETIFLPPAFDLSWVSASLVREAARFGGDVSRVVHPVVAAALARRFGS